MKIFRILAPINNYSKRSQVARDVAYGAQQRKSVNIFSRNDGKSTLPVVMFWHGGSWKDGDKDEYHFVGDFLASIGAVGVIVGHPLYPEQTFPGFIDDAEEAIDWTRKNIDKYGGNNNEIYLMGHSAGAHTALIASLKNEHSFVKGCISLASPASVSSKYYSHIFDEQTFTQGSQRPVYYLDAALKSREYLIVQGERDFLVTAKGARQMIKQFQEKNMTVDGLFIASLGHGSLLASTSVALSRIFPLRKKMINLINT